MRIHLYRQIARSMVIGVTLILVCGQSSAGDAITSGPITLAALDMPSSTSIHRSTDGTRVLFAARRTGEPQYDPSYFKYYFLDKKTNLLKRVLDDADENAPLVSTDAACRIAAFTLCHGGQDGTLPRRLIFTVNLDTIEKKVLAKDENDNYSPSVSPDGKYVAFRADDGRIGIEEKKPLPHDIGRVVNVETGEVRTYSNPWFAVDSTRFEFDPPEWLDNNRVFFYSLSRDSPVYDEKGQLLTPPGSYGQIVVAIPKEKRAIVKYYSGVPMFRCVPDRERNTIWFHSVRSIIKSDWDLTQFQTVYQPPAGSQIAYRKIENGEVVFTQRKGKPWGPERGGDVRVRITPDKGIVKEPISPE